MTSRTTATTPTTARRDIGGVLRFPALAADARQAEPVTLALPLPPDALHNPADFRVHDAATPLPVQARATSTWPDGSVRWLFARTQVDLPGRAAKDITWSVAPDQQPDDGHPRVAGAITVA
ncbi:MAG: hypothetical protein ACTHMU_06780, partial [Thermomicrobiales bacterium]